MNSVDLQNIANIESFLKENDIPYVVPEQGVFDIEKHKLQLRYTNSLQLKIGYKKFGYEGTTQKYCYEISRKSEEAGVRLIWWRDFECASERKNNVIKSYILGACGKIKRRIYARDCEIREIPAKELRQFLTTNCFYGYRSASLNLGLYLKKPKADLPAGTLVMMWSVGHPFFGKKLYDLEIIRASTLLNTQCVGGASKLFAKIKSMPTIECGKKIINWQSISFYTDYCHNLGKSLPELGFKFWKYSAGGFININLESGEAFLRKPMIHKQVMEWMAAGTVVSTPLAGVKTFVYCRDGDYSKFGM